MAAHKRPSSLHQPTPRQHYGTAYLVALMLVLLAAITFIISFNRVKHTSTYVRLTARANAFGTRMVYTKQASGTALQQTLQLGLKQQQPRLAQANSTLEQQLQMPLEVVQQHHSAGLLLDANWQHQQHHQAITAMQQEYLAGLTSAEKQQMQPEPQQQLQPSIPFIIHQNYLSGSTQLTTDALQPLSHFRKEWWKSCKTHHPGWKHMLWDAAACESLLRQRYPWFLDAWAATGSSTVLKSDAIRPFILHAYGGVYLDLDSECFTNMEPWLLGAQVVLMAEVRGHEPLPTVLCPG
eukprot:GHRR01011263.1.p1 GENE.GHRR01011263.1~~GHRR01011263.1.p1  ORF type:complete len:294 (+),score=112.99 GHRR01011263.1:340-1221(+)